MLLGKIVLFGEKRPDSMKVKILSLYLVYEVFYHKEFLLCLIGESL